MKYIIAIIAAATLVGCNSKEITVVVDPAPVVDQNQAFKAVCTPDPTDVGIMVCVCENATGEAIDCPTDLVASVETPTEPPTLVTP